MKATRYIVLERGEGAGDDVVFLRDRFHPVAFVVPFLWLAGHRLYLFALLALLVQIGLWVLGRVEGFGLAGFALPLLFGLAVALEGPRLVAWRLRRKGYRETAVVNACGLEEAELIHYGTEVPRPAAQAPVPAQTPPAAAAVPMREQLPLFGWHSARTLLDTGPR